MVKISVGYTNLGTRQIRGRLGSWICLFIALNASIPNKKQCLFLAIFKKTHFRITIPIRGCSSFIWCKAWRHESESVKTMYLDAIDSLICSRALIISQTSAVNTDAESGNLMVLVSRQSRKHRTPTHNAKLREQRTPTKLVWHNGLGSIH